MRISSTLVGVLAFVALLFCIACANTAATNDDDLFGDTKVEIVGESYRLPTLQKLQSQIGMEQAMAELRPDPDNAYDGNAVKVLIDGQHVGYLSREDAKKWHTPIADLTRDTGAPVEIPVVLRGGGSGNIGVFHQ